MGLVASDAISLVVIVVFFTGQLVVHADLPAVLQAVEIGILIEELVLELGVQDMQALHRFGRTGERLEAVLDGRDLHRVLPGERVELVALEQERLPEPGCLLAERGGRGHAAEVWAGTDVVWVCRGRPRWRAHRGVPGKIRGAPSARDPASGQPALPSARCSGRRPVYTALGTDFLEGNQTVSGGSTFTSICLPPLIGQTWSSPSMGSEPPCQS